MRNAPVAKAAVHAMGGRHGTVAEQPGAIQERPSGWPHHDRMAHRIPNIVPITIAIGFVAAAVVTGQPDRIVTHGATSFIVGLATFAVLRSGGVAKLLAALLLWIGPNEAGFEFVCLAGMLIGASALLGVAVSGRDTRVPAWPPVVLAFLVLAGDGAILDRELSPMPDLGLRRSLSE